MVIQWSSTTHIYEHHVHTAGLRAGGVPKGFTVNCILKRLDKIKIRGAHKYLKYRLFHMRSARRAVQITALLLIRFRKGFTEETSF